MIHSFTNRNRFQSRSSLLILLGLFLVGSASVISAGGEQASVRTKSKASAYYPERWEWQQKTPEEMGLDSATLQEAIAFANAHEGTGGSKDLREYITRSFAREPHNEIIGPVRDRTGVNGLVVRQGYIVAEWGDTKRADMTFSITKSYLATVAGLALDLGLIRDVDDRVQEYVQDGTFDSPQNSKITWRHLLNQTSEWEGTLWDKPDWADRWSGTMRVLREPGTGWKYNDVRVNVLAYALLHVWRKPLPQILKEKIMDPIGASSTWRWHGYQNSYVTIDGAQVQSVSGGGHWGGGMFISSRDHARFGYLHLRHGQWKDRRLLSEKWIALATTPAPVYPTYGCLWWLNTDRKLLPSASASNFFALGSGTSIIWVDPEHDLVVVVRWIERNQIDGFIQRVLAAIKPIK
jgi:CubicO group peptidase (beta-lactamase class C family)